MTLRRKLDLIMHYFILFIIGLVRSLDIKRIPGRIMYVVMSNLEALLEDNVNYNVIMFIINF